MDDVNHLAANLKLKVWERGEDGKCIQEKLHVWHLIYM
jgi:hypothetical protein